MQPIQPPNRQRLLDISGAPCCEGQADGRGHKIIKLNIGSLAAFGFDSPEGIQRDMIRNLPSAAGYTDSKGIFAARGRSCTTASRSASGA